MHHRNGGHDKMRQKVNQETLVAPWRTIPGEPLDHQGLPVRLTADLGNKTNKQHAPEIKGEKCLAIQCEMCKQKMLWDKEVGYFFCTACRYATGPQNTEKAKPWKEKD